VDNTAEAGRPCANPVSGIGECAFLQQSAPRSAFQETESGCGDSEASRTCTSCHRYSSSDQPALLRGWRPL